MAPGKAERFDAWNPGLSSELPAGLLPRVTLYDPANSATRYDEAKEAASFCGMKPQDLAAFNASRLAMHEVLIRVTADLYVPDGPSYEELGLNLRSMAARILDRHIGPRMAELDAALAEIRARAGEWLGARLERDLRPRPAAAPAATSLWARLSGKAAAKPAPAPAEPPEIGALAEWQAATAATGDAFELACLKALHAVVGGIVGQRGRLMADRALVVRLASVLVSNSYGASRLGELIGPIFLAAAEAEGYRLLPFQAEPFVMNVKGASAAGKSTIRPLQRELAERLGVAWQDFALVSPDYWRKFLIDYDGLGADYKYAAMLTGQELEIIDKKLDRYMEEKAARNEMPHLLIDRFRFDSFAPASSQQADGRLLSRFGHTVFMFFVITPPPATVERAWKRGRETGRYKAVDDLLYHNIEAYTGMPQLFLNWVNKERQKVHFEFLDNSVPFGKRPRTAAFGWNGQLTVLDPECIRNLSRYARINVEATRPEEVYLEAPAAGEDILATFIGLIPKVRFVDPRSLKLLAAYDDGACRYAAAGFLKKAGLPGAPGGRAGKAPALGDLGAEKTCTVGDWGG